MSASSCSMSRPAPSLRRTPAGCLPWCAGCGRAAEFSLDRILRLMVGRSLTEQFPRVPHTLGEPILEVHDVAGVPLPNGVSLTLRRGEILGLAGIIGAGRTEFLRTI